MDILLKPKMDFVFKKIFGNENHPMILVSFLNAVMDNKDSNVITSVEIKNTDILKEHIESKFSMLGIKATTNKGEQINIEIQVKNEKDMVERSLYYWSKMYSSQLETGGSYKKLARTVCINILDFNYMNNEHYHTTCALMDTSRKEIVTDKLELHFIELPKLKHLGSTKDTINMLDIWTTFIKNPESDLILEMEMKNSIIKEAKEELQKLSLDKEQRALYEERLSTLINMRSSLEYSREEGREEGEYNKALSVARTAIAQDLTVELIATLTGLSIEEIEKIKSENI